MSASFCTSLLLVEVQKVKKKGKKDQPTHGKASLEETAKWARSFQPGVEMLRGDTVKGCKVWNSTGMENRGCLCTISSV